MRSLTLGTRGSTLALAQADLVAGLLRARFPEVDVRTRTIVASGDEQLRVPAYELALDAFVDRLEEALLAGEVDAVVHSYKDLPAIGRPGLTIGAVPIRADRRDVLVSRDGRRLAELPAGAIVGTSSLRRSAWLGAHHPRLTARAIRGPVDVRVRLVREGEYDAALLAAAGLVRLGLSHVITEYFDVETLPPAAAQGALAVQCRTGDTATLALLDAIDDQALRRIVEEERALEALESNV